MMRSLSVTFPVFSLAMLLAPKAYAICPICTIAVGAGVGFSRWLGVDDAVTGLWVGALIVSVTMWTINWFNGRDIRFPFRNAITAAGYYAITFIPLYYTNFFSHPINSMGLTSDKLVLGVVVGSFAFLTAAMWYEWMKARNGGHAYFPYQKVAMPVSLLVLLSGIFYVITL